MRSVIESANAKDREERGRWLTVEGEILNWRNPKAKSNTYHGVGSVQTDNRIDASRFNLKLCEKPDQLGSFHSTLELK